MSDETTTTICPVCHYFQMSTERVWCMYCDELTHGERAHLRMQGRIAVAAERVADLDARLHAQQERLDQLRVRLDDLARLRLGDAKTLNDRINDLHGAINHLGQHGKLPEGWIPY